MVRRLYLYSLALFISSLTIGQIDNLKHTEGYKTSPYGQLGRITIIGKGDQSMILIAGWGFDDSVFNEFTSKRKDQYTMYLVTLPGFGNTAAPPMPTANENYGELYWTQGIISGLKDLITREELDKPIIMSYFTYSNVIALRMALDYPDLISKVIIVSGMAKFMANYPSFEPSNLEGRKYYVEKILAPNWFKTVSKETWDRGNFSADGFSLDSTLAANYWEQMSSVPIPVMVRYLCEYYCTDLSLEYQNLSVPTLVVIPSFTDDLYANPGNQYWSTFFHHSWWGARPSSEYFHLITITETHAFILDDQPEKLINVIDEFVSGALKPFDLMR